MSASGGCYQKSPEYEEKVHIEYLLVHAYKTGIFPLCMTNRDDIKILSKNNPNHLSRFLDWS